MASPTKGCGRSATSPTPGRFFAPSDWEYYQEVNRKFADAVLEEMEGTESPWCWCRTITSRCCRG